MTEAQPKINWFQFLFDDSSSKPQSKEMLFGVFLSRDVFEIQAQKTEQKQTLALSGSG